MSGGSITLINSTFYNNQASGDGGALIATQGMFYFYNVTLAGNHAGGSGGAVRTNASAGAFLYNTLVANSTTLAQQPFQTALLVEIVPILAAQSL